MGGSRAADSLEEVWIPSDLDIVAFQYRDTFHGEIRRGAVGNDPSYPEALRSICER
jgi:hypothetical protein